MADNSDARASWFRDIIFPLLILLGFLIICVLRPRELLAFGFEVWGYELPPFPIILIVATAAGLASISAHFSRHIPNWAAWSAILLGAFLTILAFAALNSVVGVYCTAAICPGASAYVFQDGLPVLVPDGYVGETVMIDKSFRNALYFSVVTFTTLGYGDMQPSPNFRLYAGYQAVLGYLYLGMIVGIVIDHGVNSRDSGSGSGGQTAGDAEKGRTPKPASPKGTPTSNRFAAVLQRHFGHISAVRACFSAITLYLALWGASATAYGLPGFYLPALIQVPIIFGGIIWISLG
ncbi:potassium channel family protein [Ruegeria conchae]|uniref:Ion channel n=1 Tax=Ruegeria conchae TaxID=981384 RepID=A0A497ZSM7_9RHOB|nr:potassium channel family protein [Ruegeria conchae]RLK10967.1 ion channel [Ruegeria conchae]